MTDPVAAPTATPDEPEHRASWLELFFDLVVVVAIATLTERFEDHADGWSLAKVVIMYLAIWLVWTSFMLYANVAADKTRRRSMLIAMACIAVMAAAVPEADEVQRGRIFAVAYIVARFVASGTWQNTGRVLIDWPIAQLSVGLVPWFVSIWVHEPARYYLWALGVALDVGYALFYQNGPGLLEQFQRRKDQHVRRRQRGGGKRRRAGRQDPTLGGEVTAVEVNQSHFGERLGTFTIIVLGEVVSQIVLAASRVDWDRPFILGAVSSFLLLFGLWWLTFQYSSYTEEDSAGDALPPHLALPLHFLTTLAIMLIAAGLGDIVGHPQEPLGTGLRWLLGGGMAAYLLFTQAALAFTQWERPWWLALIGSAVIALPLFLAGFGGQLQDWALGLGFALIVGSQVLFRRADLRAAQAGPVEPARS